jgi:parvulin-like peptidyl-prolyl isomerase
MRRSWFSMTLLLSALFLVQIMGVTACQTPKKQAVKATPTVDKAAEPAVDKAAKPGVDKAAEPVVDKAAKAPADTAAKAPSDKAGPQKYSGDVARVNGQPISADIFNAEIGKVVKPGSKIPAERLARIESNILNRLIDDAVVDQAVIGEGISISEAEFDVEYKVYKERFKTEEQYQNFLKYGRMSEDQVRARVKEKAALKKLLKKKYGMGVTDEEIRAFYEKNNRFYKERETVHVKQIVVRLPKKATPEQISQADAKVKTIQAELREKPFEDVAREHSEDLSKKKGGDMEPITRGRYLKAVEDVAFSMKPNEISKPIKTQVGYHIIKLVEKTGERMKSYDEVKGQIAETLSNRNFYSAKRKLTDELKKLAKVERLIEVADPKATPRPGKAKPSSGAKASPKMAPKAKTPATTGAAK